MKRKRRVSPASWAAVLSVIDSAVQDVREKDNLDDATWDLLSRDNVTVKWEDGKPQAFVYGQRVFPTEVTPDA